MNITIINIVQRWIKNMKPFVQGDFKVTIFYSNLYHVNAFQKIKGCKSKHFNLNNMIWTNLFQSYKMYLCKSTNSKRNYS